MSFYRPFKEWFPPAKTPSLGERLSKLERDLADAGIENTRANEEILRLERKLGEERRNNIELGRRRHSDQQHIDELRHELSNMHFQLDKAYEHLKGMEKLSHDYAALLKENKELKKKLDIRDRREKSFERNGSSGSQRHKKNTGDENKNSKGGAKTGDIGHGRRGFAEDDEGVILEYVDELPENFSCCALASLIAVGETLQSVIRVIPMRVQKYLLRKKIYECASCKKRLVATPGDVLPKSLYSNSVICELLFEIFICFGTVSATAQRLGMLTGTVFNILDRISKLFEPCYDKILLELSESHYANADETRWRIDGDNGYAWIFINDCLAVYLFRETRASCIPAEIFGYRTNPKLLDAPATTDSTHPADEEISGDSEKNKPKRITIVSDRYPVYNMLDVENQYCYAHLLRDSEGIKDGLKEVPKEVELFCDAMAELLAESMHLCANTELSDECYYRKAALLKKQILEIIEADARDGGIQAYQHIWRSKKESMFKWVEDRRIPCDNNRAERSLRPVVIARKTAFGSQGEKGRRAREIIMTVLHTAKQRGIDIRKFIQDALEAAVRNKDADLYQLLKPPIPN